MARGLVAAVSVLWASLCAAARFETLEVPAGAGAPPIRAIVWTPCTQPAASTVLGPFTLATTRSCPVQGRALPLIVISHGNGGTRLSHHDTATALADAGFVAVSFDHPGNSFGDNGAEQSPAIFGSRVADARRVIAYMATQWAGRAALARNSIGAFGLSRGGYTVLALAGAQHSAEASKQRFCSAHLMGGAAVPQALCVFIRLSSWVGWSA